MVSRLPRSADVKAASGCVTSTVPVTVALELVASRPARSQLLAEAEAIARVEDSSVTRHLSQLAAVGTETAQSRK